MSNPWAGEVSLVMNGTAYSCKLTLGALAEMETELNGACLLDIVRRIEAGEQTSRDVLALVVAGLRGGGWNGGATDLLTAEIEGGPLEAARVAAQLLARAFTLPDYDK